MTSLRWKSVTLTLVVKRHMPTRALFMLCEYVNEKRKKKLTLNMFKFNFKVQQLQAKFKSESVKVAKLALHLEKGFED